MLDEAELERTLDLWASMWRAEERVHFERALERVVDGNAPPALRAAAVAACRIIGTPRLLGAAERAWWFLDEQLLAEIDALVEPRARILRHAARQDRAAVAFLVEKTVRDPDNRVADRLLDRVDIRELYAVMSVTFEDEVRAEAARRIARRGPHQRRRLFAALDLRPDAFEAELAVDVPLDDLCDEGTADGGWLPLEIELSLSA